MEPPAFFQLHDMLVSNHGLQDYGEFDSIKALGMFLWALAKNVSPRGMGDHFKRGLGCWNVSLTL